jgi:hypothetical protein
MSVDTTVLRRFSRGFSVLIAFGLTAAAVLAYLLPVGWLTGLLQHFPAYYALAWFFVACLAWFSQANKRLAYAALMGCLIFTCYWAFPRIPVAQHQVAEGQAIRLVWANLWHQHQVVEDFVDWIDQMEPQPDVIGVAEVHQSASLALLRERFPYGLSDPDSGLALFDRSCDCPWRWARIASKSSPRTPWFRWASVTSSPLIDSRITLRITRKPS